jgi:hypothetical protein
MPTSLDPPHPTTPHFLSHHIFQSSPSSTPLTDTAPSTESSSHWPTTSFEIFTNIPSSFQCMVGAAPPHWPTTSFEIFSNIPSSFQRMVGAPSPLTALCEAIPTAMQQSTLLACGSYDITSQWFWIVVFHV